MESFAGRLAVVTGGGTGMGRELVRQLAAEGCAVAMCDVIAENMAETADLALKDAPEGVRVTSHLCDVSIEEQVLRFRDEVLEQHQTDHVHLLFNNAGVGGGGSFVAGDRAEWERTFNICWGGVYLCSRAFLPLVIAADSGYIVNTSSVNGFFASLGQGMAHTAYPSAKFAVKGFTESLIEDLRLNAPHVKCAVVMPGHIGTSIVLNSRRVLAGSDSDEITDEEIAVMKDGLVRRGIPADMAPDDVRKLITMMGEGFRDNAPTTAAQAATIILDGVKAGEWRILVGDDAVALDQAVRSDPIGVYGDSGQSIASIVAAVQAQT